MAGGGGGTSADIPDASVATMSAGRRRFSLLPLGDNEVSIPLTPEQSAKAAQAANAAAIRAAEEAALFLSSK
jgi:hypothetical protein